MAAPVGTLEALRGLLHELYLSGDDHRREAADTALRAFIKDKQAWRLSLELLSSSQQEYERAFAASVLRHQACKSRDLAEAAPQLLSQQLVAAVFVAPAASAHTAVNQLAAAAGTLAVRCPGLPAEQLAATMLALASQAQAQAQAQDSVTPAALGSQQAERDCALLKLLAALPDACASLDVSMHPQRREAVRHALAADTSVAPLLHVACSLGAGHARSMAALQLLQAWCGTGSPPAGLCTTPAVLDQLHAWLLDPELSSPAAEALAALYCTCEGTAAQSSEVVELLAALVRRLQPALDSLAGTASQAMAHGHAEHSRHLLFTALAVLNAAGRALESVADGCTTLSASVGQQPQQQQQLAGLVPGAAEYVCACLLQLLQHHDTEVVIASLQFWDEQLESWASAGSTVAVAPHLQQRRAAQLARLLQALLQRMALPPAVGAAATADARDLPEQTQAVRRELADTFRSAADAVGPCQVVHQLAGLGQQASASSGPWALEVVLYGLNLTWARQKDPPDLGTAKAVLALAVTALAPGVPPKLAGTALTLVGGMTALLLALDEAAASEPAACGRSQEEQQIQQPPDLLATLLATLLQLLQPGNPPCLRRNAATTCWRLCSHPGLAAALATRHGAWAQALCQLFVEQGGMTERGGQGDNVSSSEFLLRAACLLCSTGGQTCSTNGAGQPPRHQAELLQQLLGQPVAALDAALDGASRGAMGTEQGGLPLTCCVIQLEALAAMLALLAKPASAARATLPALLEPAWPVLCHAAELAGRQGGELLQAVCGLAAALAQVSSAAALHLLRPLCEQPASPCVLAAVQAVVGAAAGEPPQQQQQQQQGSAAVQEAMRASTQAAAASAEHAADPEWQVPLLRLGAAAARQAPGALAQPATLEAVLRVLQQGLRSWHRDVCEAAVDCTAALCCVGCLQPGASAGAHAPGVQQLRQQLDSGLGASLVLGLLLGGAGCMPPYMVSPLADGLHAIWRRVLQARFAAWLTAAVLELAPADLAPWMGWKQEALHAALGELLSQQSLDDGRLFKKRLKVLCGGKKKGALGAPPARG